MDMSKEIFIYLGMKKERQNIILMQHMQFNPVTKDQLINICGQVYIAMINNGLIYSTDGPRTIPYLLIYNTLCDSSVLPVLINHISSPIIEFTDKTVNDLLISAIKAPRIPNQTTVIVNVKIKDGIPLFTEVFDILMSEEFINTTRRFPDSVKMNYRPLERFICVKNVPNN